MVGMPTRNANSVAAPRLRVPNIIAAKMVAADREVPGNTAATTCARPTAMATFQVMAVSASFSPVLCSAQNISKAPSTSAQATGCTLSGRLRPILPAIRPRAAVIRNATDNFSA